jgi:hypothetical protein
MIRGGEALAIAPISILLVQYFIVHREAFVSDLENDESRKCY